MHFIFKKKFIIILIITYIEKIIFIYLRKKESILPARVFYVCVHVWLLSCQLIIEGDNAHVIARVGNIVPTEDAIGKDMRSQLAKCGRRCWGDTPPRKATISEQRLMLADFLIAIRDRRTPLLPASLLQL